MEVAIWCPTSDNASIGPERTQIPTDRPQEIKIEDSPPGALSAARLKHSDIGLVQTDEGARRPPGRRAQSSCILGRVTAAGRKKSAFY